MKVFNENLDRITILHMAGKTTMSKMQQVVESQKNNLVIKDDDISVIVIATKNYVKDSVVIHQLTFNNIKYYNGAQYLDESKWNNTLKIGYILNNLNKIKTKYTLILDARDTLLCDNLGKNFIQKFKKFNTKILFNSSAYRYPSWVAVNKMDNSSKLEPGVKPFLNSGVCFGETLALRSLYSVIKQAYDSYGYLTTSEQLLVKVGIANANLIKSVALDSKDILFKCVHQALDDPDYLIVKEMDNYIIKTILIKKYSSKRFKKKIKIKLNKAKIILYPNCKNHEEDVAKFIADYKAK